MVSEPCYKALEEQIIKNKSVRETVFQVLGVLIKKYNHGTSCLIKLVQVRITLYFMFYISDESDLVSQLNPVGGASSPEPIKNFEVSLIQTKA